MKQKVKVDEAEMKALSDVIPVNVLLDTKKLATYAMEHKLTPMEIAQIITYTTLRFPEHRIIDIAGDNGITFGELYEYYERARVNFIIIHRVNFLVHQSMINVYDLLEKEKRLRFGAKKHSKDAEKTWKTYEDTHRKQMPQDAWYALQDHFVVTEDMLSDRIEKVYTTLRDHMIQMGWRDVELKGRIELAFLVSKCARHSMNAYLKEFLDACGADFGKCFAYADISAMTKSFVRMTEALGIKVQTDKYGYPEIADMNLDKSTRFGWAWDDFMEDLRDDELMDKSALKAISFNPTVEAEYQKALEEDNQKELDDSLEKLGEKFKVTKQK